MDKKLHIVKMTFSKLIYKFNVIPIKISAAPSCVFFSETDKQILKFMCKCKKPRIAKIVLKNEIKTHTS
jgi:hypothetical protein